MLVGREGELAALADLVDAARQGTAGSLVLRGDPGVGKSSLLDRVAATAARATVLRTQGLEVESPLAYAALHHLLLPVMSWRDQLPTPQARALRVAFGEEDGAAVEPFLMGVATLGLLSAAAEERLVVCLVDDAHWLDDASADALLFCTRRLGADRVAVVFSVREGVPSRLDKQGLPELTVPGLGADEARELLDRALADGQSAEVTERLLAEADGNPLALLELPRGLTQDQLRGAAPLPPQLRLTDRVEGVFLDRVRRLPDAAQTLLLLAAADDTGDAAVLRAAATRLGLPAEAIEAGTASGLLRADGDAMTLRHPLVRSAVYQAATEDERRGAHAALADALDGFGRHERAAWQRAAATTGPDPEVAAMLGQVGQRAQRGGAHSAALAAFERAASLTTDPGQRAARTFAAARSAWAAGDSARAQTLLAEATRTATDPAPLADVARLRGHIEVNLGSPDLAHRIFVEAAAEVLPTDPERALELATLAAVMRTHGADSGTRLRETEQLASPVDDEPARTACLRQLFVSMTRTAEGDVRGASEALTAAAAIGTDVDDREVLWNIGNGALHLGDDDVQAQFYALALSRARDTGAVTAVVYALQRLCFSSFLAADLLATRTNAQEAFGLGETLHQPAMTTPPLAWLTLLAALQGTDDYDDLLRRVEDGIERAPLGILADPVHDLVRWAKGTRAAATGDPTGAAHHLGRFRTSSLGRMAVVQRIDTAVRADEPTEAADAVAGLADFAEATGQPWALAAVAFGRAVTHGSASEAEDLFTTALDHQRTARRPLDEARIQLSYGEWLRRAGRRVDARVHLRHALETFQDARAEPLVQRTTQELRASGETARKRDPSTLVKLTPMELKIAQLVASGMSNKDVAAQVWVSPRTVAFHLRNVFAKAQITSRGELANLDLA
ncbi:MAG: AAA family ATPase [Nocardioidaceae bacterium]